MTQSARPDPTELPAGDASVLVGRAEEAPAELVVDANAAGQRLDAFLAERLPDRSRVQLRRAISAGTVFVDGRRTKPAYRLCGGERVTLTLPEIPREGPAPENVPLDVLFEDAALVVLNKPPGMVVHPGKGHWSGTLTAALAFHFEQLSSVGGATRPGIVHRLDRDTSGVMVVAKTDQAHLALAEQFESRRIEKEYFAVVVGVPDHDRDLIEQPIGPHPYHREKMAIRPQHPDAREATTFYEVQERFAGFASLRVFPKTGRTHQIRLHLTHIGFAVLCDKLYGGRSQITVGDLLTGQPDSQLLLDRQALHARRLKFEHPTSGQPLEFEAPIPGDMQRLIDALRRHRPMAHGRRVPYR